MSTPRNEEKKSIEEKKPTMPSLEEKKANVDIENKVRQEFEAFRKRLSEKGIPETEINKIMKPIIDEAKVTSENIKQITQKMADELKQSNLLEDKKQLALAELSVAIDNCANFIEREEEKQQKKADEKAKEKADQTPDEAENQEENKEKNKEKKETGLSPILQAWYNAFGVCKDIAKGAGKMTATYVKEKVKNKMADIEKNWTDYKRDTKITRDPDKKPSPPLTNPNEAVSRTYASATSSQDVKEEVRPTISNRNPR